MAISLSDRVRRLTVPVADAAGDLRAVGQFLYERGQTDGLPVIPPTEPLVLEMLEHTERAAWESVEALREKLVQADRRIERLAPPVEGWPELLATLDAVKSEVIATGPVANSADEPNSTPTIAGMNAAYSP